MVAARRNRNAKTRKVRATVAGMAGNTTAIRAIESRERNAVKSARKTQMELNGLGFKRNAETAQEAKQRRKIAKAEKALKNAKKHLHVIMKRKGNTAKDRTVMLQKLNGQKRIERTTKNEANAGRKALATHKANAKRRRTTMARRGTTRLQRIGSSVYTTFEPTLSALALA